MGKRITLMDVVLSKKPMMGVATFGFRAPLKAIKQLDMSLLEIQASPLLKISNVFELILRIHVRLIV